MVAQNRIIMVYNLARLKSKYQVICIVLHRVMRETHLYFKRFSICESLMKIKDIFFYFLSKLFLGYLDLHGILTEFYYKF